MLGFYVLLRLFGAVMLGFQTVYDRENRLLFGLGQVTDVYHYTVVCIQKTVNRSSEDLRHFN